MNKDKICFNIDTRLSTSYVLMKMLTSWPPNLNFKGTGIVRFDHPVKDKMIADWLNEVLDV